MSWNYETRVLLAYDEARVKVVHEKLQRLPEVRQYYPCPSHDTAFYDKSMAFLQVGH